MQTRDYLNGSHETLMQRIEQLQKRIDTLKNELQNPKASDGFKKFAQNLFDRRN